MASSIAMRACPAPCHATRAGRHAGASRRPTSSASSVSVVARAVNAGETSGKATEDGKPVPPALTSEMGVDYAPFQALLEAGEWEKADDEHRRLMCVLAGEEAEDREWVYFTEVADMPTTDLRTIDELWKHYSNGRFGFSVQRKIWVSQKRQWPKFFKKIDWTTGENGDYRKFPQEFQWRADAAQGHLPLTNALRGTQLLAALLEHPAFGPGLPERTSEGSFYEGTSSRETPIRLELPTVGGVLDVVGRFAKFLTLFAQELVK